jgi:hypothetical protein
MTDSKEESRQIGRWRAFYRRAAGVFTLLAALVAGVAAFTGNLSSIEQFAKSWFYPPLPEVVLRDSRFLEMRDTVGRPLDPDDVATLSPDGVLAIVIETVAEKKGASTLQHCNAEFLNAKNRQFNSNGRSDPNVQDYSFRAGGDQRTLQIHVDIRRQDLTREAKLRLVCAGGINTPWNPVSGMPDSRIPPQIIE